MNRSVFTTKIGNFRLLEEKGYALELAYTQEEATEIMTDLAKTVQAQLEEYCAGIRKEFDFPYAPKGTEFQTAVWRELEKIPYGETRSYRDIAVALGNPKACRAVGGAIHHNPILIAVPCHRVIGTNGSLTGFGAGIDLKEVLLKLEGWGGNG